MVTRALLFLGICALAPFTTHAASLYLSPGTGTYKVGDTITATIYVESTGQAMNAVSGTVSVPTDSFDIVGVSNSGSIVNFWVQEPVRQGTSATFEGVVLNPGYSGPAGKIATVTLRAKRTGTGSLSFSSASILANDGKGTNLLSGTRGATYTIGEGATPPPAPQAPAVPVGDEEEGDDTEGPTIDTFTVQNRDSRTNPLISVNIRASDRSGVALYELSLDGGAYLSWEDFASGVYKLTVGPGAHTLSLRVVDTYGNETRDYVVFTVEPLSTPRIITYPERFTLGDIDARVAGDAPTGITRVTLTLAPQLIAKNSSGFFGSSVSALPRTIEAVVATDGTWSVPLGSIDIAGEYLLSVTGHDTRGASSFPSVPVYVSARVPLVSAILSFVSSWPILVLIILVLGGLLWWKRHTLSGNVAPHLSKMRTELKTAFSTMHRNISKERKLLEHRDGADKKEEEEMLDALEENIETTQERIEAEMEKLEDSAGQEEQKG